MPRISKKKQSSSSDSDSGPDDRNAPPPSKKAKESSSNKNDEPAGGGDGATSWTLEGMRQVRINEFRGRKMVDIREFYEKDGKVLPGKKGISLSASQWKKLLAITDDVTRALEE
ncbi:LOW QUALITY PROTEIN: RNA polymerase II transcriptional coactivator [Drosophila innubila]|uniref:LOW QUALITY PROTEIN: RNA polymerase II transcriptional coactivator n=1 Tax=Drosophila innubila TaxID=198719 RepID=UPI00148BAF12|nr:LOW QUALITY PROTEIN: RNA polymerase II transcriptional coactivator [Drosophila innubila]